MAPAITTEVMFDVEDLTRRHVDDLEGFFGKEDVGPKKMS